MIMYWQKIQKKKNPKRLIELISDYYKITGYRFNTQKSISFLSNSKEQVGVEVKTQYHLH